MTTKTARNSLFGIAVLATLAITLLTALAHRG